MRKLYIFSEEGECVLKCNRIQATDMTKIGQDSRSGQVLPHQTHSYMSLQSLLCAPVRNHIGTGSGTPSNCFKLGA